MDDQRVARQCSLHEDRPDICVTSKSHPLQVFIRSTGIRSPRMHDVPWKDVKVRFVTSVVVGLKGLRLIVDVPRLGGSRQFTRQFPCDLLPRRAPNTPATPPP